MKDANGVLPKGIAVKENPYLYNVSVELYDGDKVIDKVTQKTGFRYFHADPEKGFFLNGKYLNLYGFCRHEDVKGNYCPNCGADMRGGKP